jgi:hypothetical protein
VSAHIETSLSSTKDADKSGARRGSGQAQHVGDRAPTVLAETQIGFRSRTQDRKLRGGSF